MIKALARAKINLYLAVKGRRPDGYHDLETVMQSLSLADDLTVEVADHSRVQISWAEGLQGQIPDQPDIVERTVAASRFEGANRPAIYLKKRIPIGAGLGGASADAAAALLALSELQDDSVRHPLDVDSLAIQLGADVPFCLLGGTALATGVGEKLRPMPCNADLWWVLGISDVMLKTPAVYQRFDELMPAGHVPSGNGSAAGSLEQMAAALSTGDLSGVARNLSNELEVAAFDLLPDLRVRKEAMAQAGALGSVMTGSGSAIAGLCRDEEHAQKVAVAVEDEFVRVEIARNTSVGAEVVAR